MRNNWEQHDAVLLQEIPYLGTSSILKIFSQEGGLLTLMSRKKIGAIPFSRSEWIIRKTRGECYSLRECTLLDPFLSLRANYETLVSAASLARDLLRSQSPEKAAPQLYLSLLACLSHLALNPVTISQSFRLKLLQFEGVLRLEPVCLHCSRPSSSLSGGESVCEEHRSPFTIPFSSHEWTTLLTLSSARRFSDLAQVSLDVESVKKIEQLFLQRIC